MTIRLMIIALLTCMVAPCAQAMQKGKRKAEDVLENATTKKAKTGSKKSKNNSSSSSSQFVTAEELEQEETDPAALLDNALDEITVLENQLDESEAQRKATEMQKKKIKAALKESQDRETKLREENDQLRNTLTTSSNTSKMNIQAMAKQFNALTNQQALELNQQKIKILALKKALQDTTAETLQMKVELQKLAPYPNLCAQHEATIQELIGQIKALQDMIEQQEKDQEKHNSMFA